jgi:hypothetical protein
MPQSVMSGMAPPDIAGTCIGAARQRLVGLHAGPRCDAGPGVPRGLLPPLQ